MLFGPDPDPKGTHQLWWSTAAAVSLAVSALGIILFATKDSSSWEPNLQEQITTGIVSGLAFMCLILSAYQLYAGPQEDPVEAFKDGKDDTEEVRRLNESQTQDRARRRELRRQRYIEVSEAMKHEYELERERREAAHLYRGVPEPGVPAVLSPAHLSPSPATPACPRQAAVPAASLAAAVGTPVLAEPLETWPLRRIADLLRRELALADGLPVVEVVTESCRQLGLTPPGSSGVTVADAARTAAAQVAPAVFPSGANGIIVASPTGAEVAAAELDPCEAAPVPPQLPPLPPPPPLAAFELSDFASPVVVQIQSGLVSTISAEEGSPAPPEQAFRSPDPGRPPVSPDPGRPPVSPDPGRPPVSPDPGRPP
eukprot:Hpha_TRINITY_DN13929_c0_g2::TRINITY_DN13929_c0_g2_i3::g.35765::m.35765